jgi:hypothetical protein
MDSYRKIAIIAEVLFLTEFVTYGLGLHCLRFHSLPYSAKDSRVPK